MRMIGSWQWATSAVVLGSLIAGCGQDSDSSNNDDTHNAGCNLRGRLIVNVPTRDGTVYLGGEAVGRGDAVDLAVSAPRDSIRTAWVEGEDGTRWMTVLSSRRDELVPIGGTLAINARTTAVAMLMLNPWLFAGVSEQNVAVADILWGSPALDQLSAVLETKPPGAGGVSDELQAAYVDAVVGLMRQLRELGADVTDVAGAAVALQPTEPRRLFEFPSGQVFETRATILRNGRQAELTYGQPSSFVSDILFGEDDPLKLHTLLSLDTLDAIVLFAEIDRPAFHSMGEDPFDIRHDRIWPYKSTPEISYYSIANVFDLLDVAGSVSNLLISGSDLFVPADPSAAGGPGPRIPLDRHGSYSVRYFTGAMQRPGPTGSVLSDPQLAELNRRALVANLVKMGLKTAQAFVPLKYDDAKLLNNFASALASRLPELLSADLSQSSAADLAPMVLLISEIAADTLVVPVLKETVEDAAVDGVLAWAKSLVNETTKAVKEAVEEASADLESTQAKVVAYGMLSQLVLSHAMESEIFMVGEYGECHTSNDCFADQFCFEGACAFREGHCGDGVRQTPESCDGDCPATCDDHDPCTLNRRTGTPQGCDVRCEYVPIVGCPAAAPSCTELACCEHECSGEGSSCTADGSIRQACSPDALGCLHLSGESCAFGCTASACNPPPSCVDADGDGHPVYAAAYCATGDDKCDDNANNWTGPGCSGCVDVDEDGYGNRCDRGNDCDDANAGIHINCPVPQAPTFDPTPTLQDTVALGNKVHFTGAVRDDVGLASVEIQVTGPRTENKVVHSKSLGGLSKSLSDYYFDSVDSQYGGVTGDYEITLRFTDVEGLKDPLV